MHNITYRLPNTEHHVKHQVPVVVAYVNLTLPLIATILIARFPLFFRNVSYHVLLSKSLCHSLLAPSLHKRLYLVKWPQCTCILPNEYVTSSVELTVMLVFLFLLQH